MPAASDDVVIPKAGLMVSDNALVTLPLALSVSLTVKLAVPVPVGVPEMTPLVPPSNSPVGRTPAEIAQVNGPVPLAATYDATWAVCPEPIRELVR